MSGANLEKFVEIVLTWIITIKLRLQCELHQIVQENQKVLDNSISIDTYKWNLFQKILLYKKINQIIHRNETSLAFRGYVEVAP